MAEGLAGSSSVPAGHDQIPVLAGRR